jgi:GAF domain-containing protein
MRRWVTSLPAKVADSLIVPVLAIGVLVIAGLVLDFLDDDVEVWIVLVAAVFFGAAGLAVGRRDGGTQELVSQLLLELDLNQYYANHLYEVLETLQKIISQSIPGVSFSEFVERGMLEPARQYLTQGPGEDIRLSVLVPDERHQDFVMEFAAGHRLESRGSFRLPIAGSFAGHAYSSGEIQWTNDVDTDQRWSKHPEARPDRAYGSLVSVPIRVRDQVVGVLNVISTYKSAFSPADRTYIELLGSILNVAWSLVEEEDGDG